MDINELLRADLNANYEQMSRGIDFVSNFYDGPLSGITILEGEKLWFHCIEMQLDDNGTERRKFALYCLPEEEWHLVDAMVDSFRRHVGTHCDRGDGAIGIVRPKSEWDKHYSVYQNRAIPDLAKGQIVAYVAE